MKPLPPPRHPPVDPEPLNPWDAVNALKVTIASLIQGGAPETEIANAQLELAAEEQKAR